MIVLLAEGDNVGVALRDIGAGETRASQATAAEIAGIEAIPLGHKIALEPIAEGREDHPLRRAGRHRQGRQSPPGALVHVHNVRSQYLDNDEDHYE